MLARERLQLAPVATHFNASNAGLGVRGMRFIVQTPGIQWCVVGVTHDAFTQHIQAVEDVQV
jgi:hypothetical protein